MATPAQNPEIQLGFGERPHGIAAALFGPNIFVMGGDDKSDIQQSIYTAETGFAASSLGNKESWSTSRLTMPNSFAPKQPSSFLPQTKSGCALAIQSGDVPALYVFWCQPDNGFMATWVTDVTQPSEGGGPVQPTANWQAGLLLANLNDASIPMTGTGSVSAVSLGSQAFLVAFPLMADLAFVGLYYVADQTPTQTVQLLAGTFGTWPARAGPRCIFRQISIRAPAAGRSSMWCSRFRPMPT